MDTYESQRDSFLRDLAELLNVRPEDFPANPPLDEDNWDSLAVLSAIALIDKHFGVTVSTERLLNCHSAGQVMELAEAAVKRPARPDAG